MNKWRLNDDFLLPPFMLESLQTDYIEQEKTVRIRLESSSYYSMMLKPFEAHWRSRD